MKVLRKCYIYILEFITGNIIFNFVYSIIKTMTLINIGATKETFIENLKNSFIETFIIYIVIYLILVIIQVLYDKYIIDKLNNKLKQQRKRGDENEQ